MIIETPAMMLDMRRIKKNIANQQEMADMQSVKLRPHIKTHKMPELAKLQLSRGAVGITCASLSEAECMAASGINDIFIAYQIIGKNKLERLMALSEKVRVITGVDSREGAAALSEMAGRHGLVAEVRLEVDTGMRRAGVWWENAVELAKYVAGLPHMKLSGIFTFKHSLYREKPTADNRLSAVEEVERIMFAAEGISAAGIRIADISGGSTPTSEFYLEYKGLTEIRSGSYILANNNAAYIAVTVISTPEAFRAVVDGGSKAFSGDFQLDAPPYFKKSHGVVVNHPHLSLVRMSEEHGVLESIDGEKPTGLHIGQILHIVPNHICTCMNLFESCYIVNEDGTIRREKIAARGMSQ